jgi:uncharacterized protein YdeI (YjbR/CyaY-like superfamily)
MRPTFFRSPSELRSWFERNHARSKEVWVGFHKKVSGKTGITHSEAVDEALCFGWIDGVGKGIDDRRYMIRFTPRRSKSNWSVVNVKRARELVAEGRMRPAGLEAFRVRDESAQYSYEAPARELDPDLERRFRARRRAWALFQSQPPGYRRSATHWVMSAKREETRRRRLDVLIEHSAKGSKVPPLAAPSRGSSNT